MLKELDKKLREARIRQTFATLIEQLADYDALLEQQGADSVQLQVSGWELFSVRDSLARFESLVVYRPEEEGHER